MAMENTKAHYIHILMEKLSSRQSRNPSYSLRAFANDIGIHPSSLSQILKGNRGLPQSKLNQVIKALELSPIQASAFKESLTQKSETNNSPVKEKATVLLEEVHFKIIAEWEHYAVLDLFELDAFTPNFNEICQRLNLTKFRTEVVLKNLMTAGLLKKLPSGNYQRSVGNFKTSEDISSSALKKAHNENLELAKKKLESIALEMRDFSSISFGLDLDNIDEAKTLIREFRLRFANLLNKGNKTQVYQLALQLYPLGDLNYKHENEE